MKRTASEVLAGLGTAVMLASFAPCVHAQTPGCAAVPTGLVSWWPGDGDANDLTGDNNGTVVGGLTFAAGEVGQGFSLNGLDSTVLIPASASLNVGLASGFTIEAWINPVNVSDNDPVIEWSTVPPGSPSLGVHLWVGFPATGSLFANIADTNGQWHEIYTPPGAVQANVFQHVALTYEKGTATGRLFLNGAMVAEQILGTFTPETTFDLYIGQRPSGSVSSTTFSGTVDEVVLYNRALSSSEIFTIYASGSAGKCQGPPAILNQPASQTARLGENLTFDVTAGGTPPLTYQWRLNGTNLPGATNATLILNSVRLSDSGTYSVSVTNSLDSVLSSNAFLNVLPPSLQISRSGGTVIIWWSTNASAFELEASASLGTSQNWTQMNWPILVLGDQNVVAADAGVGRRFFRLSKQ